MLITCFQFEIKFLTIFLILGRLTHKTPIFIHFRKTIEKSLNPFCGFLKTVEQTGDKKKLNSNIFLKKMLSIQFPSMKIV